MKTQFFWLAPLAGLLALTACKTTPSEPPPADVSVSPARSAETRTAAAAPQATASQATAQSSGSLVNLAKKAPGLVSVGDTFSYELTATAQTDVGNATVTDMVPEGASFVSSQPAATPDGNKLTWNLGDMNQGESKTILVTLKADRQGELKYCATVWAVPRVCVTTMVGKAQLALTKTGPEVARLGSNVTYRVVVQNTGNTTAKNVRMTDQVPEGFSAPNGQKELSFDIGDLAAGASKTFDVTLRADQRGKFINKAIAVSSNAGQAAGEAPTVVVQGGIQITKVTKDKSLFVNRTATYDIEVSNTGDIPLTGVVLTDRAAPETVIAAAEGGTVTGTTATWNLGSLAAGQKKNVAIRILSKTPGRFTDTASVSSDQGLTASAQDFSEWRGVTGVLVEMVDDPDPIQVGETSTFTIRVSNQGSTMAIADLKIAVALPAELDLVPNTVSNGGTISGKTITWPVISSVAPKASVTRTYIAKGVKAGDARTKASVTTTMRPEPIEEDESTTVY